jgi:adenylosuccinate synthase
LACSDVEREVLREFPLYGNTEINAEGNVETGACAVYYQVPDSSDQVRNYFVEQLIDNGWTVEAEPAAGTLVSAQRGEFSYVVYSEVLASSMNLAVHVGQD